MDVKKQNLIDKVQKKARVLNNKIKRFEKVESQFEGVNVQQDMIDLLKEQVTNRWRAEVPKTLVEKGETTRDLMTANGRLTTSTKMLDRLSTQQLEEYLSDMHEFTTESRFASKKSFVESEDVWHAKADKWYDHIKDRLTDKQRELMEKDKTKYFRQFVYSEQEARHRTKGITGYVEWDSEQYIRKMLEYELMFEKDDFDDVVAEEQTRLVIDRMEDTINHETSRSTI